VPKEEDLWEEVKEKGEREGENVHISVLGETTGIG
jgi:hypothetical protein